MQYLFLDIPELDIIFPLKGKQPKVKHNKQKCGG